MRMIVLTASTMKKTIDGITYSGKCVTGYDVDNQKIVRLVRNRRGAPIENPYCRRFHPMDIFEIQVYEYCPILCQTENVISNYTQAKRIGRYEKSIRNIYSAVSKIDNGDISFMLDGYHKLSKIEYFNHSLELVKVSSLRITGKKSSFTCNGRMYNYVSVTDPDYVQNEDSEINVGDAILVISIPTDDYNGNGYYKFVAAVFPLQQEVWSREEDQALLSERQKGWDIQLIASEHRRTKEEIKRRLSILLDT